jgi:hypothetical protein
MFAGGRTQHRYVCMALLLHHFMVASASRGAHRSFVMDMVLRRCLYNAVAAAVGRTRAASSARVSTLHTRADFIAAGAIMPPISIAQAAVCVGGGSRLPRGARGTRDGIPGL